MNAAPPVKADHVDCLQISLAAERVARAEVSLALATTQRDALFAALCRKYQLNEQDTINVATGDIVREGDEGTK